MLVTGAVQGDGAQSDDASSYRSDFDNSVDDAVAAMAIDGGGAGDESAPPVMVEPVAPAASDHAGSPVKSPESHTPLATAAAAAAPAAAVSAATAAVEDGDVLDAANDDADSYKEDFASVDSAQSSFDATEMLDGVIAEIKASPKKKAAVVDDGKTRF